MCGHPKDDSHCRTWLNRVATAMTSTSAAFVATVRAFSICTFCAFSSTADAQPTPSPTPSAQSESDGEMGSKELQGSAAVHAAFSQDGSHVYAIDVETSNLFDINLQK